MLKSLQSRARIHEARTAGQYDTVRMLFEAYERALGFSLDFQRFDQELELLPGRYAAPGGCILLAYRDDGEPTGCVALRPLEAGICEMKRLFVLPDAQGQGIGRDLAIAIIERARELGYKKMRLDTVASLIAANTLYATLGFHSIAAYCHNPLPGARFFELEL